MNLELWAAVDIMGGKVVRLTKGKTESMKVYSGDPVETARKWELHGASGIHVVDLDATLGRGSNLELALSIAKKVNIPVQLGGGIRDPNTAKHVLTGGIRRVVLGTMAFKNQAGLEVLLAEFGSKRMVVALDYSGSNVVIKGWQELTPHSLVDTFNKFVGLGLDTFLLTSVDRDGTLTGPDVKTLSTICELRKGRIYASGGVRNYDDLLYLQKIGVAGVILGKSLYESTLQLSNASSMIRSGS